MIATSYDVVYIQRRGFIMRWMMWRAMSAPALAAGLAAVTAATSNSLKNYLALESIQAGGSFD